MVDKHAYSDKLDAIQEIIKRRQLEAPVVDDLHGLRENLRDYAFRILMIGGFSSGKSAFLNTLLDREALLKESQAPETTIATELVYDEAEFVEAVSASGEHKRFLLEDAATLSPVDWRYLIYHVRCQFLKEHPNLVFVDMPGLDSSIEYHNKAIAQYISKGSAYILLVSCEDGTLKRSTSEFLQEVTQYPQSITCFVSKTDLRPEEETLRTVEQIRNEIAVIYGDTVPVQPLSVYDKDFAGKVEKELGRFDPQKLFELRFRPAVNALIATCRTALQTACDALSLDTHELNREIESCKAARDRLKQKLAQEKEELERKYGRQVIPAVLSDVEQALAQQAERLTSALTVSPDAFNAAVNSILRPVLYNSSQKNISASFDEFVEHINPADFSIGDGEALQQSVRDGLELLRGYAESLRQNGEESQSRKDGKQIYQIVTGALAILTDFINPVLELIIVFLPTIFDLIKKLNQKAQ